jgi:hypothetical protein
MKISIKPFSVNKAWQGRRYRTAEYRAFADELTLKLKPMEIPEGDLVIRFIFGVSNMGADWDNNIKVAQDIIAKYYGFNDSRIIEGSARKVKVKKGEEFIDFTIMQDIENKGE